VVPLVDPVGFRSAVDLVETLLFWLSGDDWHITALAQNASRPAVATGVGQVDTVALASGGLDSTCAALLSGAATTLIGIRDSKAAARAQSLVQGDLTGLWGSVTYERVGVHARQPRELSSRTRSAMFTALGTALAAARHSSSLIVPENGFTSLNPPLAANRGGPHTTRSTHPTTFAYANAVNRALGLDVRLQNPYEWLTKGDLVSAAAQHVGRSLLESVVPHTFSCARANGQFFRGGHAFLNCGICVSCMTRRGAVRAAGLTDNTEYLLDRLEGETLNRFMAERGNDLPVVRVLRGWKPSTADILALEPLPDGFDYDRGRALLERGVEELVNGLP
jgi:hypothetical protein